MPSVVAAVGAAEGLVTFVQDRRKRQSSSSTDFHAAAMVAVLARSEADLGALRGRGRMAQKSTAALSLPWTDDYSDIIGAILRKKLGR